MMLSCRMWLVLHANEEEETSNAAGRWRRWFMMRIQTVNYHWPRLMSPTLAWQLSKLIRCSNQLHTPTSVRERHRDRQREREEDYVMPLGLIKTLDLIKTQCQIILDFFVYCKRMGFEQLHKRDLFCVKTNPVFLCISNPWPRIWNYTCKLRKLP